MKKLFALLALLTLYTVEAQKTVEIVSSKKLNADREITIGLPPSYANNKSKKYPLLILLDGDYLFDPFQGALNYGAYWDDIPEVIVVGISQNKKEERYTDCAVDETTGLPAESGERFFEFIGQELIPALEKSYRLAPFKIIAGHDTTAGFLNFYLYKDQPLFDAYISLSPELPKGMEEQLPERFQTIQKNIYYYQSTADGDVKKMQQRIVNLDIAAKKITKPGFNYYFDDFKAASHYSLVLHSIPDALYSFFQVYQPISTAEFDQKIAVLPSGYVDYLNKKYETMEKAFSMKMPIRVNDFNAIAAAIMKNKQYPEFDQLAAVAKKNYPKSMLSDYYMGMLYEKTGETKKAIKAYQTAYQKEEIGGLTKDMMLGKADELKNM